MTIQREYPGGPFVAQCNTCLDTEELEGTNRAEAVEDAKRRDYTIHFDSRSCTCGYCTKQTRAAAEASFLEAENRYEEYRNAA